MSDFQKTLTIKKTMKPHQCEQCGLTINKGLPAIKSTGRQDGHFWSGYEHQECHEAGRAWAKLQNCWGEEFLWFQHAYGDEDHYDWLLTNYPLVAERLGIEVDTQP